MSVEALPNQMPSLPRGPQCLRLGRGTNPGRDALREVGRACPGARPVLCRPGAWAGSLLKGRARSARVPAQSQPLACHLQALGG